MAEFPQLDLLSEVEELASERSEMAHIMDGKGVEDSFNFLLDEDLGINIGLPSQGLFVGDDSMLAVDSSNHLLMDDPLLTMDNSNALLDLQPATPGFNPETLIPVSLPADSFALDPAPSPDSPAEAPVELDVGEATYQKNQTPSDTDTNCSLGEKSKPVRIIVNTRLQFREKMVAPALLPKPGHNLVKIPKTVHSANVVSIRRFRAGEKVGPSAKSNGAPRVGRSQLRQDASRSPLQRELQKESTSSTEIAERGDTPFWSLRSRHTSISSVSSDSEPINTGTKRKAYELDPLPDPRMERCRRNAINAKKNRELKKAHMTELEEKVQAVSRERDELAGENENLRKAKLKLEQEVKHLNNILKNQSQLSALIGKISPSSVILGDLSSSGNEDEIISSGMCLHVDGCEATIEYCSYCAKKAGKKLLM